MSLAEVCRSKVEALRPTCFQLLEQSLTIASFSGSEKEQADLLLKFFVDHRVPALRTPRGSVVAMVVPEFPLAWPAGDLDVKLFQKCRNQLKNKGMPLLGFDAHMDVVEPGSLESWASPPFTPVVREGKLFARGACDMKGGMAAMATAMVGAAGHLRSGGALGRALLGCFVSEEEVAEGLALSEIVDELGLNPDWLLLGEPTDLGLARGQRGKCEFHLRARGIRAHTSVPEVGENAIYKMGKALQDVERLDREEYQRVGPAEERILERSTLVATAVRTEPFGRSSVPDFAEAFVTVRFARDQARSSILERLRRDPIWSEIEVGCTRYRGVSYTGKEGLWVCDHPAWETPSGHAFCLLMQRAARALWNLPLEEKIWPFSTDGVFSSGRAGIPTLGFGPGREPVCHAVDEWVEIDSVDRAMELYLMLALLPED